MKVTLGLCQLAVCSDKQTNLNNAKQAILQAKEADIIILPEVWNSPYDSTQFPQHAETAGGQSCTMLSALAKETGRYIVGGSIPEQDGDKVYNTSFVFDPKGAIIARHRKMHLFDISVEGGQHFQESDTLTAGEEVTVFDTPWGKVGLCICYDYRFPELARLMTLKGAQLIIVPAAFNMTTGPAHWELMFRSRSLDNQLYSVGVAPARDESGGYVSYANSIVTSPWGEVLHRLGTEQEVALMEIDLSRNETVRQQLPLLKHRRIDLYTLEERQ